MPSEIFQCRGGVRKANEDGQKSRYFNTPDNRAVVHSAATGQI